MGGRKVARNCRSPRDRVGLGAAAHARETSLFLSSAISLSVVPLAFSAPIAHSSARSFRQSGLSLFLSFQFALALILARSLAHEHSHKKREQMASKLTSQSGLKRANPRTTDAGEIGTETNSSPREEKLPCHVANNIHYYFCSTK